MKRVLAVLVLAGLAWSCDTSPAASTEPVPELDSADLAPIEVEVSNYSIETTTIEVLEESVELKMLESHVFSVPGYLDEITIFAEGGYFQFYAGQADIEPGVLNKVTITPNIGWIKLSNFSSFVLSSPRYGGGFFLWNADMATDDGWPTLDFAETRYLRVTKDTPQFEYITFSIPDGTKYRLVETGVYFLPAIGSTKYVSINDSSEVEEVR